MNERKHEFGAIPESACRFAGGEIEFRENGEGSKTAPIKLKARSGQSINHWFWGKVVHDMSGCKHKQRIAVDYAHNEGEILGYVNHFDTESGDLYLSGALTPFSDSDRASEVMHKMKAGVPYEASIFFGGDGIKIQEVAEGEMAPVNGYQFEGPGVIIREWPLRGVAICPYGADSNTESVSLTGGKSFAAEVVKTEKEEIVMSEEKLTVEAEEKVEAVAVEAVSVEAEVKVEAEAVEAEKPSEVSLTVERDTFKAELESAQAESAELKAKFAEMVSEVERLTKRAVEAETKLSAIEKGAEPVSAIPASTELSAWDKAVLGGRNRK
jgi:hypothetical protein